MDIQAHADALFNPLHPRFERDSRICLITNFKSDDSVVLLCRFLNRKSPISAIWILEGLVPLFQVVSTFLFRSFRLESLGSLEIFLQA
jgi:hypothetical protein